MLDKLLKVEPSVHIEEPNAQLVSQISKFGKKEHLLEQMAKKEHKKSTLPSIYREKNKENPHLFSEEEFDSIPLDKFKITIPPRAKEKTKTNVVAEVDKTYDEIKGLKSMSKTLCAQVQNKLSWATSDKEYEE